MNSTMQGSLNKRWSLALLLLLCASLPAAAHVVVKELPAPTAGESAWKYVWLGYEHILPLGFDHILFVISLFLLSPRLKPIIIQATTFTVAHSVTLGLAAYGVIAPPSRIVEPLIAISIMFVALQNIISPTLKPSRIGIVFLFGLVHGMGFAGALSELGLPKEHFLLSLLSFNVGVELGQLTVILTAFLAVGYWLGDKPIYRKLVVVPVSCIIIAIAGWWTVERIFFA